MLSPSCSKRGNWSDDPPGPHGDIDPETFYITDHYRGYPAVLVRLASVDPEGLRVLLEQAWRSKAPKGLIAHFDAGRDP